LTCFDCSRNTFNLCWAIYQPPETMQKCWAKTILLSQIDMFCLFFFQFVTLHTQHPWNSCKAIVKKEMSIKMSLNISRWQVNKEREALGRHLTPKDLLLF
jgi:hypothetical protein